MNEATRDQAFRRFRQFADAQRPEAMVDAGSGLTGADLRVIADVLEDPGPWLGLVRIEHMDLGRYAANVRGFGDKAI